MNLDVAKRSHFELHCLVLVNSSGYSIPQRLASNKYISCPHSVFTCFFVSQRKGRLLPYTGLTD